MKARRGFTLLELIVVIIIIGVLATLGFTQYSKVVEKGRRAEAATNLGALRSMAYAWNQEGGHGTAYPADPSSLLGLPASCSQNTHYFAYSMSPGTGQGTASRCTSGGKQPPATEGYKLMLDINGGKSSDPAGLW